MLPPLIGIIGRVLDENGKPVRSAGAGKDTFYRLVLAPRGYVRLALADAVRGLGLAWTLYRSADEPTPIDLATRVPALYYALYGVAKSPEAREVIRVAGQLGRAVDPGLWVYGALMEAKRLLETGMRVAITDLRFVNEYAAVLGLKEALLEFYRTHLTNGGGSLLHVREMLTRHWDEGGLLPPPGWAGIIAVERYVPGAKPDPHPSEVELLDAPAEYVVRSSNLLEMVRRGEEVAGPVEAYLKYGTPAALLN